MTIETEANGDSKSTNKRSSSMVRSFVDLFMPHKRFLSCFGCSSRPSTKYFFLAVHYFNSFVLIAQHARQAVVQVRLSLIACLWSVQDIKLVLLLCSWTRQCSSGGDRARTDDPASRTYT
jgi:hypothetical protein